MVVDNTFIHFNMTPCTNITIQDLLRSSSVISSKHSSPGSKCGLSVSDVFPTARNTLNTSLESNKSNSELANGTMNHSVFDSTKSTLIGTSRTVEEPLKTAGKQVQEYKATQKFNWVPKTRERTYKAKTPAERTRKYREKKKMLALAAKQKALIQTVLDTTESDMKSSDEAVDRSICAQQNTKKGRGDGTPAKTDAQRAREYRARLKLERERCNLPASQDSGPAKEYTHVTVKKIPKSSAERSRDYRARKKQSLADFRSNVPLNLVEVGEYLPQGICASVLNLSSQNVASYGHVAHPPSLISDGAAEKAHLYRVKLLQSAVGPSTAVPADESVYVGDKYNTITLESEPLEKGNVPLINSESLEEEELKGTSILEPLISIKEELLEEELEPLVCVTLSPFKQELFQEEYENYEDDDPLN